MRTYTVTLTALTTYEQTIDAHTEEEAVSIVERDFNEGVPLDLLDEVVESVEAIPVEE